MTPQFLLRLQAPEKFVHGHTRLAQDAAERAHFHFIVHGNYTSVGATCYCPLQNQVTAALSHASEPEAFEGADNLA